ncbi:hypothetical protein GRI72_04805 [Altererythrobacter marinus]|jgi:hypothetical protein|uniref:Uncharacterized protein n=1 Tax=Pelagerythrobacter marinus TaxID=538382 RepID=A0ABW9UW46_9SPHN|nr:hypothetical protein [Pelagerythrobacter marinus]MEC9066282.1 hypothetical protein [Pseudomonadota bacterium]MXO68144.1 hypothetical protein [Pelagerythrobacter marinus]
MTPAEKPVADADGITATMWGQEVTLSLDFVALVFFAGSIFCAWTVARSLQTGTYDWKGLRADRDSEPMLFALQVAVTALIGVCAIVGALALFFDGAQ